MINCAYINCKHNSFEITVDMKNFILSGGIVSGSGECNCPEDINLSLEEENEIYLVCENYEESDKF